MEEPNLAQVATVKDFEYLKSQIYILKGMLSELDDTLKSVNKHLVHRLEKVEGLPERIYEEVLGRMTTLEGGNGAITRYIADLVIRLSKLEAHNRVDTYCNCEWCRSHRNAKQTY